MERTGPIAGTYVATIVPGFLAILCVFLANLPLSLFSGIMPSPLLALMPVYFWCLVRPDLMPPLLAFMVGVLEDLFSGGPPGIWGAAFVATYALVDRQRDSFAGLSGYGAILGFGVAMFCCAGTAYLLMAIYFWRMPPFAMLLVQVAITVLFYVPGAALLNLIQRRLVGPLRSDF